MNNQPVTEPQRFASDIFWVAAYNLAIPLIGLVTLPALTRNYTEATYAVWIQSVFIVGLFSFLLSMYMGNAIVRFLAAEDDKTVRRRSLGAVLWFTIVISFIAIIISLLFKQNLSTILFATSAYASLVPLIFSWAGIEAVFLVLIFYLMARRMIKRLSIIQISIAVYKMAAIMILAMAGSTLEGIIGSIVAGEAVLVVVVLAMITKDIGWPKPAIHGLKSYLAFSMPLIPVVVIFWAMSVSDRYVITYLLDLSQAGIYSASYSIGTLIGLIYGPIQIVLFPVLSRLWEQKERIKVINYLEYSNKLLITLAIPGAAGIYILSQPLLGILAAPGYLAGGGLVLLIALASTLLGLYQVNVSVIMLVQKTKWLMLAIITAATINITMNLILIPVIGIAGAAVSALITYLILAVTVMIWSRRYVRYSVDIPFFAKVIAGALIMAGCINFIHLSGVLGIVAVFVAGIIIFTLWMWLTRAFSSADIDLIKEIVTGLRQGALFR